MTATPSPFQPSVNAEANRQFTTAQDCLTKGDADAALTWFRRAAITDPNFFSAQFQIGMLCRDKARLDKMFLRYAYEAFYKAASLDLANEEAHNQFIQASSQTGRMEELMMAYEKWTAADPANEFLQRCKRNVLTISMAMMPQSVDLPNAETGGLKRFVTGSAVLLLVVGVGILIATPLLVKSGKLKAEQVKGVAPVGMAMAAGGVIGFISRRFL